MTNKISTDGTCDCAGSTLYDPPNPKALTYCPTHAAAPELVALLHERPTVSLSGKQYDDFTAWQARVDALLTRIGEEAR